MKQLPYIRRVRVWMGMLLVPLLMLFFLLFPKQTAQGVSLGLSTLANGLIPALFPFLVAANLASDPACVAFLAKPFGFIARLMHLPKEAGVLFVLSLVGGYPVGGLLVCRAVNAGSLSKRQGSVLLTACANAAPSFLVGFVGQHLLGSPMIGWILAGLQAIFALLTGVVCGHFLLKRPTAAKQMKLWQNQPILQTPQKPQIPPTFSFANALIPAVQQAAAAMLSISGFVVFFSALVTPLLQFTGEKSGALLAALTEISGGLPRLTAAFSVRENSGVLLEALLGFLIGFALGFGGLCVAGQVIFSLSAQGSTVCSPLPYLITRPIIGLLMGLCTAGVMVALPDRLLATVAQACVAVSGSATVRVFSAAPLASALLLGLCGLLLTLSPKNAARRS